MSTSKYPNRDALDKALRTYLEAMYSFVNKCLGEGVIRDALRLPSDSNIEEKIEVKDIAHLIRTWSHWDDHFKEEFKIIDRDDIRYYDARSVTSLIVEGRNQVSHQRLKELDSEFTRSQLFFIAEILGKINRLDAQREVEKIRDKCFVEVEQDKANLEKLLADREERLKELSEKMINNAVKLEEKNKKIEKLSDSLERKEEKNKELAEKFLSEKLEKTKYQDQHNSISKQLATVQTERDAYKEQVETSSDELKKVKVERDTAKEDFVAISNELTSVQAEKNASERYLAVTQNLLTTVAIGDQVVFPPLGTDAAVRIIDRRGTDKRNYLLRLLEQKQPTIIYVQSDEKIDELLTLVGPEKEAVMRRCDGRTSEAEKIKTLAKLESVECLAIVSNTTFSTLTPSHCVEHFVFCHLTPGLDEFFKRCQPALTSEKNTYLHLIYNKKDIEGVNQWLAQKYLDEEALRGFYRELKKLAKASSGSVKFEEICNALDMVELGLETGLSIFEELGFLERDETGIITPFLSPMPRELEESDTYCIGKELKKETADFRDFQLEYSIEQIWEKMLEKLNINSKQILRESDLHKNRFKISEKDSDVQLTTEQDRITPSAPDVWPQRGMSAFDALRRRAARNFTSVDTTLSTIREFSSSDLDDWHSPTEDYEVSSTIFEDEEDYQNKYDLAIQFAREHGFIVLEEGIAQLINDQKDPRYDFTEDEKNMLSAFQDALKDSQTQPEQSTEVVEKDSTASDETLEARHTPKPTRANAKVTEEQVREIRARHEAGESYSKLAREFELTPTGVRNIVLRNTWKHVK